MAVSQQTFARKKPDQLVYLELGSGNGGMLLSVSEDGFRFRAVSPLRPDGGVPFAFSLDGKHRLIGVGEVEWLEDDGKSGGMRFTDISPEARAAIDQWLAADSRSHSGREAAPATAAPLDTMEKIREELRRGYPARPPEEPRGSHRETPRKTSDFNEPLTPAEKPQPKTNFVPPASTPPAESPAKPPSVFTNSAFLKIPREAPADKPPLPAAAVAHVVMPPARVAPEPPSPRPPFAHVPSVIPAAPAAPAASSNEAAPLPSLRTLTVSDSGAVRSATEPVRPHIPYIPPPDDSYDNAWANAKLTAPAESPHLSRAAAGSIIGIALLVIVGALAFNFRQDIGTMVIDIGQKISGENHSAAPDSSPAPQTTADSGSPGDGQTGDADNPSLKNDDVPAASPSASTPTGSTASNAGAPKSNSKAANENAANKPPSLANKTSSANPIPKPASVNPTPRETQPTTSDARPVKPVEAPPITAPTDSGTGQEEFTAARDILKGSNREQDLSRAVELLWSGVRKGYVPAEVALADLYRKGDGVEKNCDQARVLLVAASKKGSPDARRLLEYMAENGCE